MEHRDRVVIKSFIFGLAWPLVWMPLRHWLAPHYAAAIAGFVTTALFHWLPPIVQRDLTVAKSALIAVASGLTAGVAVFLVERLL